MKIRLERTLEDWGTLGEVFINDEFFCYSLENPVRDVKVPSDTAIWSGTYQVGFRVETTPMTQRYQKKYKWFHKHIEVKDVRDFTGIYFHVGNWTKDTDGCILLGDGMRKHAEMITSSTSAFTDFYEKVSVALLRDEEVTLEVI